MTRSIIVNNLAKSYGGGPPAVQGISFEVKEGEFFGFLRPNGAGKSTTIKILTTRMTKSLGYVSIGGFDLDKDPKKIRKLIGVQSQETSLDLDLTGRENLMPWPSAACSQAQHSLKTSSQSF